MDLEVPAPPMSCLGGAIGRPIEIPFWTENWTKAHDLKIKSRREEVTMMVSF